MNRTSHHGHRPAIASLLSVLLWLGATQAAAAQETPAGESQSIDAKTQQDAKEVAAHLLEVHDRDAELSCDKGVENARYGVETMLEVGEKNVKGGYLPQAQFDAAAKPMKALLPQITVADCTSADGNKREFYRCMSSDYNHVMACAQAHPF